MRKSFVFLLAFVTALLFVSCEEDKESGVILLLTPGDIVQKARSGEKLVYSIEAFSNSGNIRNLKFTSYHQDQGLITILDSNINTPRIHFDFQYTVPSAADSSDIKLQFKVSDEYNYTSAVTRYIRISGDGVLLKEQSGITLYGAGSGKPDAFNLAKGNLLNSATVENDSLMDIFAYNDTTMTPGVLCREWRSHSGIRFVRFNDFNYAQATQTGIENAYRIGNKFNYIKGLRPEDVIIIGNEKQALGVIKIIYIFDEEDLTMDRYIFNLKTIRR